MSEATPYDDVPYFSRPISHASTERLACVATLFGMQPPALETARVLELGCAAGGHLIPLASQFPDARFVGVDLSEQQIGHGQSRVDALGLENLELRHLSATEIDAAFGEFDYVVAHGFYTWVPEAVRAHALEILKTNLAPNGVGYISHNILPGWAFQRSLREMMRFHSREASAPEERVAQSREFLQFLMAETPPGTHYANQLATEGGALIDTPDFHLLHDHLAEINHPEYFHEFMAAAEAHDLQFLGDCELWTMNTARLSPQAREVVESIPNRVVREQYMDFLWRRSFRHTLLIHGDVRLDLRLDPSRLEPFLLRLEGGLSGDANLVSQEPLVLSTENVSIGIQAPVPKAALLALAETPQGVPAKDLVTLAYQRLGGSPGPRDEDMMRGFLFGNVMAGTITLGLKVHPYTLTPGERPTAPAFARLAASKGDPFVPNLRCGSLALEGLEQALLPLLDGTRDVAALATETGKDASVVKEALQTLAARALIET